MKQVQTQYMRRFIGAMAGYVALLFLSLAGIERWPDSIWRFALALLPLAPLGVALWAMLAFLTRQDELQQHIQLGATAFAASAAGLLTFAYGLLENVGFPPFRTIWFLPLIIMLWGIGAAIFSRKYQ